MIYGVAPCAACATRIDNGYLFEVEPSKVEIEEESAKSGLNASPLSRPVEPVAAVCVGLTEGGRQLRAIRQSANCRRTLQPGSATRFRSPTPKVTGGRGEPTMASQVVKRSRRTKSQVSDELPSRLATFLLPRRPRPQHPLVPVAMKLFFFVFKD